MTIIKNGELEDIKENIEKGIKMVKEKAQEKAENFIDDNLEIVEKMNKVIDDHNKNGELKDIKKMLRIVIKIVKEKAKNIINNYSGGLTDKQERLNKIKKLLADEKLNNTELANYT